MSLIPTNRRIKELLIQFGYGKGQKGKSQTSFANSVGLNKDIISEIVNDKRVYTSPEELAAIADGFGITYERLTQDDVKLLINELETLLRSGKQLERALELADKFCLMALGTTEKSDASMYKGWTLALMRRFDDAGRYLVNTFETRVEIGDLQRLTRSCNQVMQYYVDTFQWSKLVEFIDTIKKNGYFVNDNRQMGMINLYMGIASSKNQNFADAKNYYYEGYKFVKNIDKALAARFELNISHREYFDNNLDLNLEMLERAKVNSKNDTIDLQCTIGANYVRTLIVLNDKENALREIKSCKSDFLLYNCADRNLFGKILLMESELTGSVEEIEKIVDDLHICEELRKNIAENLFNYYIEVGDIEKVKMFHTIVRDSKVTYVDYKRGEWF